MAEALIEARDIQYSYADGTTALDNFSFKVKKGSKIVIMGPNGAGKTTLFLHLNGILKPSAGALYFNGVKYKYDRRSITELRKNVGIVFQDPDSQLFSANVVQEVSFGPMNLGLSKDVVRQRVERAMRETGIMDLKDKPTHFLSQGQKKRVSIADILAMDPVVILFDEPTASLDPVCKRQTINLLDNINRQGKTIIMSTHDVDLAYSWADYIYIMVEGRLYGEGLPQDVFSNDLLLEKAGLEKPLILDIYFSLNQKGLINSNKLPKRKDQLISMIYSDKK